MLRWRSSLAGGFTVIFRPGPFILGAEVVVVEEVLSGRLSKRGLARAGALLLQGYVLKLNVDFSLRQIYEKQRITGMDRFEPTRQVDVANLCDPSGLTLKDYINDVFPRLELLRHVVCSQNIEASSQTFIVVLSHQHPPHVLRTAMTK
ncbi:hypothetical protein HYQ46_003361 [Verticillium longisporum]|nr:hypothetical protein HYQ46_003361 [Verticillium longisporum]